MSKGRVKKVMKWVFLGIASLLLLYFFVQGIRCGFAAKGAQRRLEAYHAKTATLSYGNMTYVDSGTGEAILSVHGIFGGYDQAYDTCRELAASNRIIAPSRFGYLGSDVLGGGTPAEQAAAYVQLLDKLEIDQVYILGTSAGGTTAIRFALDYPERTKGLILYCSAPPLTEKPDSYAQYQGPPSFLCNNFAMFVISPLFEPIMGMQPDTIFSMLPIEQRSVGVEIDATLTNPDMARNFDDYPIENLQVPTLIFHAEDDRLASYADMEKAVQRFPDCTFIRFETGGHLMAGHGAEIKKALQDFQK